MSKSPTGPSPRATAGPGTRAVAGLGARAVAGDALAAVLERRRPLEDALATNPAFAALTPRDRAFARLLVATTLRRLGQIDRLIKHCLARPLPRAGLRAQHVLRLGVAQLLFLDTPPHAAVSAAVDLADLWKLMAHKKLINAVLRRLSREGAALRDAQEAAGDVPRLNTPSWLWQAWNDAYGEATARAIATAHLREPPLDFTLMPSEEPGLWAERLDAEILPTGSLRRPGAGAVADLPGYAEGRWWVQDMAAALPARLLLNGLARGRPASSPGDAWRVADLCAAPGGKTAQLAAALGKNSGTAVTALDIAAPRLERLRQNLMRLQLSAETVQANAAEWRPAQPLDGVLLDAPCSATGTIRRHPDVAHAKRPDDIVKLAPVQDRLLAHAADMLKPGGILVYAVCSLEPSEGPARVAALLDSGAPVERLPIAPDEIGDLADLLTPDGDLRSLPCHLGDKGGMDGFYAARLRRRG